MKGKEKKAAVKASLANKAAEKRLNINGEPIVPKADRKPKKLKVLYARPKAKQRGGVKTPAVVASFTIGSDPEVFV